MESRSGSPYKSVSPEEAENLVRDGSVRLLDVRTPEEYRDLGHIPGALLFPVDLIASLPATLPAEGKPLLVYCEHGVRSAAAARFLSLAGYGEVLNLVGGMSRWKGPREFSPGNPFHPAGPAAWLVQNADLLPRGGEVLDVACGSGRHTLLLAAAGFRVRGVDRDAARIEALGHLALRLGFEISVEVVDLEAEPAVNFGAAVFDLVVVIRYLHRPLFPSLIRALRPGGILLYETFTAEQGRRYGRPRDPHFLLEPGELRRLAAPLGILREREGEHDGGFVSSIVARRGD